MEQLRVGDESYGIHKLDAAAARLPYTLRILLENVLRNASEEAVEAVAGWVADAEPSQEISFHPARVLLQDFTGVPAIVDLAAMRDAMRDQGGDPGAINPLIPAELVIDHSVQVDEFASRLAIGRNVELEFERNRERYAFLRWGQGAFDGCASCRRTPASSTRSTSSTSRASSRCGTASPSRTRSSAPTRTRRWSTASACSAGESAGSRPRPRCSGRRSRCSCLRSWASG